MPDTIDNNDKFLEIKGFQGNPYGVDIRVVRGKIWPLLEKKFAPFKPRSTYYFKFSVANPEAVHLIYDASHQLSDGKPCKVIFDNFFLKFCLDMIDNSIEKVKGENKYANYSKVIQSKSCGPHVDSAEFPHIHVLKGKRTLDYFMDLLGNFNQEALYFMKDSGKYWIYEDAIKLLQEKNIQPLELLPRTLKCNNSQLKDVVDFFCPYAMFKKKAGKGKQKA